MATGALSKCTTPASPDLRTASGTLARVRKPQVEGVGRLYARPLLAGLEREGDFDGRALIANPDWPHRVRNGTPFVPYSLSMLQTLV